jgi:hypothetical protein
MWPRAVEWPTFLLTAIADWDIAGSECSVLVESARMAVRGLVVLILLTGAAPPAQTSAPSTGRVIVDSAEVFDRADATGFVVAELARGSSVTIDHDAGEGWLAIEPPATVFCWLDEGALDRSTPGLARVVVDSVSPRSANPLARLPGLPLSPLRRGDEVTVLGRKPRVVPQSDGARVFVAIEPPAGQRFYVPSSSIRADSGESGVLSAPRVQIEAVPIDSALLSPGNLLPSALPPALAADLARVETAQRAILRGALETWDLDAVKRSYQDLANRYRDPDSRALLEARIARVDQQSHLAQQARRFEMLVRESRSRDVSKPVGRPIEPAAAIDYDAVGMLQPSSKLVDGKQVYSLVGENGTPTAYLSVRPGIRAERYLSSLVGVRGQVQYDSYLRNRVIDVEDLTPILEAP